MLSSRKVVASCVLLCLLIIHFKEIEAEAPVLNFKCDGNKIQSIDTDKLEKVYILMNESTHLYCNPNMKNLTNCFNGTKVNVSELKVLYVEELPPHIIGGKQVLYFHLVCQETAQLMSAAASISNITFNDKYTENVKNKVIKGSLTLTISEKPDIMNTVSETKNVVVGQPLHLFLRGPADYVISPQDCTAKPSNVPNANETQLWKTSPLCTISSSKLIDQKWINKTDHLSIRMYAFRFDSSDEVTITCRAFVCSVSDQNPNCKQVCVNSTVPNPVRHRRFAIVGSPQHAEKSASASFRIVKRDKTNAAAAGLSTPSVIVVFLLFTVTSWV